MLRAAQAYVGQTVAHPARAVAAENALEFRRRRRSFVPASPQNVPAKRFAQFGTLRARFDTPDPLAQRGNLIFRIEM